MKKLIAFLIIIFIGNTLTFSQTDITDYSSPTEYTLSGISVTGIKYLDENTLISISGLKLGEKSNSWRRYFFSNKETLETRFVF